MIVPDSVRAPLREVDILLVALYIRTSDLEYISSEVPKLILYWLENDLAYYRTQTLEQTQLYFYPQQTMGVVKALINETEIIEIDTEQSFTVTFFLR